MRNLAQSTNATNIWNGHHEAPSAAESQPNCERIFTRRHEDREDRRRKSF
jgi:hypothetical protein